MLLLLCRALVTDLYLETWLNQINQTIACFCLISQNIDPFSPHNFPFFLSWMKLQISIIKNQDEKKNIGTHNCFSKSCLRKFSKCLLTLSSPYQTGTQYVWSYFRVTLHVKSVHLVEYEGDCVLADDPNVRLQGVDLVVLLLHTRSKHMVLTHQLVSCLKHTEHSFFITPCCK